MKAPARTAARAWHAMRRLPREAPVRRVPDLDQVGVRDDVVVGVAGARVVCLDVEALVHDFPALGPAGPRARARAERWILERAALVTRRQAEQTDVNTSIQTTGVERAAHRPPLYGRSVVVPVEGGLLDVKGAGVSLEATPELALHKTGLVQLGEALREVALQRLLDTALGHATGGRVTTLPIYAVLAPGFEVRTVDGRAVPAGLLVRRAHRRPPGGSGVPPPGSPEARARLEIELVLRRYGVTSCNNGTRLEIRSEDDGPVLRYGEYPPMPLSQLSAIEECVVRERTRYLGDRGCARFDFLNVQLARGVEVDPARATVVDLGHYVTRERFEHPLVSPCEGRVLHWGEAIWPDDPRYVQPDARLAAPPERWEGSIWWDRAESIHTGSIAVAEVEEHILTLLDELAHRWPDVRASPP